MAEPASVTVAVAAGATAGILASLSLEPGPMFWGLVGAAIGVTTTPPSSKIRLAVLFICVVLASSLVGALIARHLPGVDSVEAAQLARNACSCLLAMFFHPIASAIGAQIPEFWRRIMRRVGPDAPGGPQP